MTIRQNVMRPVKAAPESRETVVFVHCSASSPRQWDAIIDTLPPGYSAVSLELIGHGKRAPWPGRAALTLRDEARQIARTVHEIGAPVHLVGHSYGGGIAVQFADDHPDLLHSLVLAEPSCFHLLEQDPDNCHLAEEMRRLTDRINRRILAGAYFDAMRLFVDFWARPGTFDSLEERQQQSLARKSLMVAHHFAGLFAAPSTLASLAGLRVPALILCGTRSPAPARAITRLLARAMPAARHRTLAGANHMAPLERPDLVVPHIAANFSMLADLPPARTG